MPTDPARILLRHTLATLAYRASKALVDAPDGFETMRAAETTRTAGQILAHMADLFDWASHLARGEHIWREASPTDWKADVARFFSGLARLDAALASDQPLGFPAERLFQGPIADALTHVGQIATLRRLAGAPVKGENYFKADIEVGRVGADQPAARAPFA